MKAREAPVLSLSDPRIRIDDPVLAELVYAVYSRVVGKMSGWRAPADRYARAISGAAIVDLRGDDPRPPLCPELEPLGWPDAKRTLRRLKLEPWDLDKAWSRSVKREGAERLARIDLPLLTEIFPPRLFRPLALMILEGPHLTARRFERWLQLVADGDAPCRSVLNQRTLKNTQTLFRSLLGHLQWLLQADPSGSSLAELWRELPPLVDIDDLEPVKTGRDTSALARRDARRGFFSLVAESERRGRKKDWDKHLNQLKLKRNLALLGTLTTTGARVEVTMAMTVTPQLRPDGTYRTGGYLREYLARGIT